MFNSSRIRLLFVALVAIGLLASAAPALAAGMAVTPQAGTYATTFTAQADGFNPNESLAVWVTLSNGSSVALNGAKANSAGSVQFSITPQASWPTGQVIVVAHGNSSKREYSATFELAQASSASTSSSGTSSYVSDPGGLTIYYQGSGYVPGEKVAAWYQDPRQVVTHQATALATVTADAAGYVSFPFTVQSNWLYGQYQITAQGLTSKHLTYNTFSFFGTITDHRAYGVSSGDITIAEWQGQYFNNVDLSGTPVLVRTDASLNFNWGSGSPASNVSADYFSAKWDTTANVANAGNYTITATADDGIRVWVDGQLVIDEWFDQPATTYSATLYISAGQHSVHVEYYDRTGDAVVSVQIVRD